MCKNLNIVWLRVIVVMCMAILLICVEDVFCQSYTFNTSEAEGILSGFGALIWGYVLKILGVSLFLVTVWMFFDGYVHETLAKKWWWIIGIWLFIFLMTQLGRIFNILISGSGADGLSVPTSPWPP